MKILHVLDHSVPLTDGYAMRTLSILREQHRRGWATACLTSPKQGGFASETEMIDGLEFHRTAPASGLLAGLPGLWPFAQMKAVEQRLREVVELERPDVIHAHSPVLNAWPALRVGRRFGLPVVYEIRAFWEDAAVDQGTNAEGDLRYRLTKHMETAALRRVDAVITICEGLRSDIVARGVDAAKITVVPNAVDVGRFCVLESRDEPLSRELGLDGCEVIGFCGSFYAYEGLDLLVRAFPAIRSGRPQAKLLLVGSGDQDLHLRSLVRELRLEQHVVFTGRVPNTEIDRYYSLMDVLAFPRTRMRLTELVTPLKPLEAMAQGRVIVASDVGGHRELIESGKTGLLFPAGSQEGLADAVIHLLDDPQLRCHLSKRGREFVEKDRTWAASVSRYADVYERLAGQRRGLPISARRE